MDRETQERTHTRKEQEGTWNFEGCLSQEQLERRFFDGSLALKKSQLVASQLL